MTRRFFLRATIDPQSDLKRGFSGVYNSWVDSPKDISDAIDEVYPDGDHDLPPPRQDPVTGWWCWDPEPGLSAFGFEDRDGFVTAMRKVTPYGQHLGCVALFASEDYSMESGADGEDLFRPGEFLGWLELGAEYKDAATMLDESTGPAP